MNYQVVLIESDPRTMDRLSKVINNTQGFTIIAMHEQVGDALGQSTMFKPNLVLFDIDAPGNMDLVHEFVSAYQGAILLCIGSHWDVNSSNKLVRDGAHGFLAKPFSSEELIQAVEIFGKHGMVRDSEILSFFSPKGKSGKTTLIANLAMSLAERSGEPVGIIDADLQFGDMAVFFNLDSKSTIVEATRDIKFLSPVTLSSYFVEVPEVENVRVLCGTKMPEYAEQVEIVPFKDMLRMAQSLFRYILIDLSPGFNPISMTATEMSDTIYMVSMVSGGFEVLHMRRSLDIFKEWPNYRSRVKTIFTRVSPCTEEERQVLEEELEYPVNAIIPNEYLLVSAAANSGRMAVDIQPDTALAKQIRLLSKSIIDDRRTSGSANNVNLLFNRR